MNLSIRMLGWLVMSLALAASTPVQGDVRPSDQRPSKEEASRASKAKLDQLFQELKQSGYSFTVEDDKTYAVGFHGKNYPDFDVEISSTVDLVFLVVTITENKNLKVTPEIALKLLTLSGDLVQDKIAINDKNGDLYVLTYLKAKTLDAQELRDNIERIANSADTVYTAVKPYFAPPRKKTK